MAFPNLLKRLFDSNGAGVKLNGGIMPYSTSSPKAAGTASPGTSDTVARGDHIHPAQTAISGNAGTATRLENKRTIDGMQFDGSANIHHYASCSTAAGTAEKAVTLAGFTLATGARITVRFTVTNTAANPTLNVNSTGAKPIQYRNAAISTGYLAANRVYEFVYDGAAWELVGDINTDTNTTYGAATTTTAGLVKVGTNISVSGGTISVANGSTTKKGVVQLSSATNSTSTTLAATASAVKTAYDKGVSAASAASKAQTAADAAQSAADAAQEAADAAQSTADTAKTNAARALTAANNAASSANTAKTVASAQAAVVTSDKRALKAPNGGTWYCYIDASYRNATMGEYTDIVKSGKYSGGASIQTANSNIILNSSICVRIA